MWYEQFLFFLFCVLGWGMFVKGTSTIWYAESDDRHEDISGVIWLAGAAFEAALAVIFWPW
jgi:hypothetical protein